MSERVIDVHGMTVDEARRQIERLIASCDKSVSQVIVVHGYHRGDAIRQMVQSPNGIRSNRIKRKRFTKNQGETIFELF